MNLLDILIAKKKSFTGETESLVRRANEAMAQANTVAEKIEDAGEALAAATAAQEAAEAANSYAQEVINDLDNIKEDISSAAAATVNSIIEENTVTNATVEDANTSAAKIKQVKFTKNGTTNSFNVEKNYTSTGANEDGGMTQKAITNALASQKYELETKINNIPAGGGSGNVIGSFDAEDAGQLVIIDEEGHLAAGSVSEEDLIKLQISTGTLTDNTIIGVEIDYANKTVTRIQGAIGLQAGSDFNQFNMYGGRKRCIVDEEGQIIKFLTNEDTISSVEDKRIMVYQPAFYYYRVPLSSIRTNNGIKLLKEQLFLSDTYHGGFKIHPLFKDENNNTLKYALFSAYENSVLRNNGTFEKSDTQNINFSNDKLVSIVNSKPISGYTQNFNYTTAVQLAENNGTGWHLTDLRYESAQQMLMIVEFCTLNIQNSFNKGISEMTTSFSGNRSCSTGSTHSLLNASGQASSTTNIMDTTYTYTTEGLCSISYRGVENPYGNIWRLVGNTVCNNKTITYNNEVINFTLANENNWVNTFGYDELHDWVYLPIETGNGASSIVPVGDFFYGGNSSNETCVLAGGLCISKENTGIFYYACDNELNIHSRSISAQVIHFPTSKSTIENNNYLLWLNS